MVSRESKTLIGDFDKVFWCKSNSTVTNVRSLVHLSSPPPHLSFGPSDKLQINISRKPLNVPQKYCISRFTKFSPNLLLLGTNKTRNYCKENSSKLTKCPICSEIVIKQSHYGGNSCQTCATFFRRNTVSPSKILQKCKTGMGSCLLSHARINNCPYCRYKYCLQNGLNPHLVNTRNSNTVKTQNLKKNKDLKKECFHEIWQPWT